MNFNETNTVREIVVNIPASTRLFEGLGIDYCCGGQRPLIEACRKANIQVSEVLGSLEKLIQTNQDTQERNWQNEPLTVLTSYIVEKHHVFTKAELPRIEKLLAKVVTVHGQNHPELISLIELFDGLNQELGPHLLKEEQVLFPYIERMEEAFITKRGIQPPFFGTVKNPVRMMMEHDSAGDVLAAMHDLTNGYQTPPDVCISYQTLYSALEAFEADLHQHIHLENNILFPRAEVMERAVEPIWQTNSSDSNGHQCFGH
ncbi:MAG TPA: iron-sulfur cluster repair di-iron protein [Blastocatellia bacterium]|nr:iron-sulfur cluster repair di-iron protein [Blastocatellia bacterium]